ncbi:ribosomal protein subunit L4 [Schizosaccharomyces japonicus yFS275]|uniref:Large ribosomal subunit protein uL29m n=1 Tax=Schizosaccharomyces japonicus (strain yFS275 / FY16936) TaxID=402676 RepID=B6JXB8_SCHJY|nr:ribosomal protein subunit L4 [Schizosaccharomyces japonicus yFS275]EEB06019.1 ribosomal protein subunit L4 [Schizosaccharomyces japonicus yFS275]
MKRTLQLFARQTRRQRVSAKLPTPKAFKPVEVSETHPLWQFFRNKQALFPPEEEAKFGRAWTAEELRIKSFDDLHGLWYNCLREKNLLSTQSTELRRLQLDVPKVLKDRNKTVGQTMARIKFVLWERQRAYESAKESEQVQKTTQSKKAK